jgi:hypothetical protein
LNGRHLGSIFSFLKGLFRTKKSGVWNLKRKERNKKSCTGSLPVQLFDILKLTNSLTSSSVSGL